MWLGLIQNMYFINSLIKLFVKKHEDYFYLYFNYNRPWGKLRNQIIGNDREIASPR